MQFESYNFINSFKNNFGKQGTKKIPAYVKQQKLLKAVDDFYLALDMDYLDICEMLATDFYYYITDKLIEASDRKINDWYETYEEKGIVSFFIAAKPTVTYKSLMSYFKTFFS